MEFRFIEGHVYDVHGPYRGCGASPEAFTFKGMVDVYENGRHTKSMMLFHKVLGEHERKHGAPAGSDYYCVAEPQVHRSLGTGYVLVYLSGERYGTSLEAMSSINRTEYKLGVAKQ